MSETPRTDELKRGIWRLMQSQEREEAYAWRDAIHCGIEQLERDLAAERERADRNQKDAERYRSLIDAPEINADSFYWSRNEKAKSATIVAEMNAIFGMTEGE